MYNFDNTLVTYQDARGVGVNTHYQQPPVGHNHYMHTQQQVYEQPTMPVYGTAYPPAYQTSHRVVAPQQSNYRVTLSPSPRRSMTQNSFNKTAYALQPKTTYTKDKPIVKVSTTKQVYYPAAHNQVEEHLELEEGKTSSIPAYNQYQTIEPMPVADTRGFEYENTRHHSPVRHHSPMRQTKTNKRIQTGGSNKNYYTSYQPAATQQINPYSTQTIVPMYTQVPTYIPQPVSYTPQVMSYSPSYPVYNPMSTSATYNQTPFQPSRTSGKHFIS